MMSSSSDELLRRGVEPVIVIDHLRVIRGKRPAIHDLSVQIARGTIPDIGDEAQEIDNIVTHKHETVHTFGWYLRKFVRDTKATGAQPIVMSLTTRNVWKDGHVSLATRYLHWANLFDRCPRFGT